MCEPRVRAPASVKKLSQTTSRHGPISQTPYSSMQTAFRAAMDTTTARANFIPCSPLKTTLKMRYPDMNRNAIRSVAVLSLLISASARAESVTVKYRGVVDLKPFSCTDTPRSSFIQRVCYDKAQSYMLINLRGVYCHYCELPPPTLEAFLAAPSMGKFYNQSIRSSGSDGPFDCRTHRVPNY